MGMFICSPVKDLKLSLWLLIMESIDRTLEDLKEKISERVTYWELVGFHNVITILRINLGRKNKRGEIDRQSLEKRTKELEKLERKVREKLNFEKVKVRNLLRRLEVRPRETVAYKKSPLKQEDEVKIEERLKKVDCVLLRSREVETIEGSKIPKYYTCIRRERSILFYPIKSLWANALLEVIYKRKKVLPRDDLAREYPEIYTKFLDKYGWRFSRKIGIFLNRMKRKGILKEDELGFYSLELEKLVNLGENY